jgi:hypothetical protein
MAWRHTWISTSSSDFIAYFFSSFQPAAPLSTVFCPFAGSMRSMEDRAAYQNRTQT